MCEQNLRSSLASATTFFEFLHKYFANDNVVFFFEYRTKYDSNSIRLSFYVPTKWEILFYYFHKSVYGCSEAFRNINCSLFEYNLYFLLRWSSACKSFIKYIGKEITWFHRSDNW